MQQVPRVALSPERSDFLRCLIPSSSDDASGKHLQKHTAVYAAGIPADEDQVKP
jgi:hypothetical protein